MTEIFDIFEKIRNEWDFFFAKEENSDFYLNSIKEIMQRKANFELTYYRDHYLKGRLYHRIRAKNFGSFKEYSILLENSDREVQILKDLLTIHTTEFFRDEKPFRYLERVLLPKIIRMKSNSSIPIRILSAPCSTGQEVYSIAIIVHYLKSKGQIPNPVQITGVDIDRDSIQKAIEGIYRADEIKKINITSLENNFDKVDKDNYRIKDEIRKYCSFSTNDLFKALPFNEKFDLITCRNLLIYISRNEQVQVISNLKHNASKDSYFMLGITEGLALMTEEDFRVESLEDHFYQYLGIKRTEKTIQKTEISNEIASQTGIKRTIKINSQKSTPFMTDNPSPTIMTNTQIKIVDIKPELGSHLESVGKTLTPISNIVKSVSDQHLEKGKKLQMPPSPDSNSISLEKSPPLTKIQTEIPISPSNIINTESIKKKMTNRNKRISKTSTKKSSISESKVSTETYANLDELEVKERAKSKEFSKRIREAKSIQEERDDVRSEITQKLDPEQIIKTDHTLEILQQREKEKSDELLRVIQEATRIKEERDTVREKITQQLQPEREIINDTTLDLMQVKEQEREELLAEIIHYAKKVRVKKSKQFQKKEIQYNAMENIIKIDKTLDIFQAKEREKSNELSEIIEQAKTKRNLKKV